MKYSDEELLTWKKATQKGLKEAGYNLTYSKDREVFKLFPSSDKTSKHIPIQISYRNIPTVTICYEKYKKSRINENDMGAVMLFLQSVKVLLAKHKEEYINIKLIHNFGAYSELYPFINLYMNQLGFFSADAQLKLFTEKTRYDLATQLINFEKEASEVYYNQQRDNQNSLRRFQVDASLPSNMTFTFHGLVDRTIKFQVNSDKKEINIRFRSAVHQKEISVDSLEWKKFEEEFHQFKQEEKLKHLFEGPQMNKNIENFLSEMIYGQYLSIKPKEIFDFLVGEGATTEEMDEKSVLRFDSPSPIIKSTKITKEHRENRGIERRNFRTNIFHCYDKFLFVGEEPEEESRINEINTNLQLLDSLEVALQKEKEWLMRIL